MTIRDDPQGWHLSKSVPVTLIFVLATQFGGGVWALAALSQQLTEQDRRLIAAEARIETMRDSDADLRSDIRVLVARMDSLIDRIERLELPNAD